MLARHRLKRPRGGGFARVPEARLSKAPLIAIVDDDQFFRESMRRLMRSLGHTVEAFPSAADFLASCRLDETACYERQAARQLHPHRVQLRPPS